VKFAANREPAVKINAAKPPRKSWLAVIFMTVGMPIHSKQNEVPSEVKCMVAC